MTTQKKRFGKKTLALLMALVMVLGTLPLGVLASERTLELVVGESAQLMGSTSENGQEEWTAEDASVVHVSENGLVTALTGGKTTVTHTYYIETASAPVPETAAPAEEAPAQPEGAVVEISAPEQEIVLDGGEKTLVHSDPAETPAAEESEETSAEPPVVTVPEVTEPEATEPEATEPEATEPEVTEPEVTEPEATEPEATEPEAAEPEAAEPEATEPEVTEPEATEPEVTEPEATEPEVTEPEAAQPAVEYIRQTERWTVTVSEVLTGTAVNDGTRILVSAPKDAFPENTELVITPVVKDEMNQLLDFVDGVLGTMLTAGTMDLEDWDPEELIRGLLMELDGSITAEEPMTAFDVSFLSPDGEKLQPAEGKTVTVTFDQEGAEDLRVYHVTEDGQAEAVETVLVDGKAQIQADAFSIYAVVGGVRQSGNSVTIQVGDSAALKHSEEHDDERSYQWSVSPRSGLKLGKPSRDGKSIEVTGQKPGTYTVTLKYQYYDGWIFGSWKNASETFTVTVAEERLPSEELTTVPTVDSTALGVDMYMFNYDGQPFGGHEWTQDNRGIKQGFIGRTTQSDGFPRVETSNGTRSLNNWFNTSEGSRANHLFLQAAYEEDGSFYYDSMENFAQLDGREFTVYDQIGTPNFEQGQSQGTTPNIYNVGNFMPYNTLDPDRTFQGASEKPVHALKEEADYYFGMYVNANFFQPEGGQVKNQDMVFEFTGDDDLWVYIDGVLVLDLGGCHDAADGSINFATGAVYAEGGKRTTIRDQFRAANQAGRAENWNGNTFADFTGHRIQIFYMERGAGASNLKIRFNIPTVPAGSVMVTKDLKGLNPAQAKTREFTMELTRNGSPLAGAAYTIAGTDVTGVTDSQGRFPLRDGQSAIFSGLEKNSTVRIREVDVDTGLFSVKYNGRTTDGVELTVPVGNGSVAATVTNTVKSGRTADLTVTKQFRSGSAPMAAAPDGFRASFELRAEDGTVVATVPYSQFVNGRYTFKDLLKGSYTVTESIEAAGAYGESTYKKTTANGETANAVTIHAGEAADFVNVYGPDTQDVTFTKTWAGHRSKTVSSIAVEITGGGTTVSGTIDGASGTIDGYDYTVSGWGTDSWSVTVQALPALESGSYAIRETAVNGVAVSGGAADAESGKWTVSQSGDALTNTYDAYDKSDIDNDVTIRIHKTNGVGALSGAKFQIYTGHFTGQPGSGNRAVGSVSAATNSRGLTTLTLKASQLPTGAYTLYEATVPAGYQRAENVPFTVTQTVESRSSEDGGHVIHTGRHISAVTTLPATVEVVDAAITGTLTVKKTVTGTTEANGPFTITVSGTSVTGAKVEEVLTLKANESKSLSLPYGQYTITETNPGDTANDRFIGVTYTGTGVAVAEDGSFDFHPAQNGAAAVEAVNAYEVKKDGQLSITKEVIWDSTKSQTPPSDAEFEFHVDKNREAYGNASFTVDGQTRTTDDKGNFTLKDGETAVFTGLTYRDQFWITENAGRAPGFVYDTGRCLYTVSSTPGSHTFHNSYFKSVPFNGDGDLTVSKVWDGDGVKPESITVQLKQNGQNYGDPVTLTGPNWNHTFENLPEYDQTDAHEAYRYTVEETAMTFGEAYTVAPHQSGFLVSRAAENNGKHEALGVWMPSGSLESGTWAQTNAWFPADNTGSIVVQKTDDATGAALPGAVFTLTGDGYRQEQTTNSDGLATFTGLKPGTYTLTETTAPDGYLSNEPSRQVIIEKDRSEHVLVEVKAPSSGNLFTNLWNWFVKKSDSSEYVHQLTITNRKDVDPTPEIPEITVANGGSFALTKQDDAGVMLDGVSFTLSYGDTELRTGTTANGVLHMDLTSQQLSALETALEKANVPFRGGEPVTLTVTETPKAGYETAEPFDVTMTCTVTLSDAPVDGKFVETHSWRVTGVEGGTASAVTVTNARTTGTLELNKTVTGISGEQADRPFTFTLTGTDVSGQAVEAQTLTVTQAQGAELTLPYGTYTLTESGTLHTTDYLWQSVGFTGGEQGAADGRSYTFDFHPAQGGSITVTAENRYAIRTDGVLTVTKTVTTEAGVNAPDQSFAFTVKLGEGTERQTVSGRTAAYAENGLYEVQLKHGQQFTVTGIPRNTAYEVTEAPDASYVTRADQAAGTIENGSTAVTAAFTNAYITQDVTFSKLETGTSNAVSGARFRLVQNGEQAASAVSTENGTVTFADVPCGVYTLEEVGHVPGYEALNRTGVTVTVTADGVAYDTGRSNEHASLENGILKVCNTHKTADITVTKTVTGYSGDEVYTFGLYTKTGNGYAPAADSISVKAGETAAFADLRTGVTYYVQETGAARTGYDLETSWTGGTVNEDGYVPVSLPLDKTEAAALECTNAYTRHTGSLTIHKALSGLTETAQLPQELAYAFTASNDEAGKTGTITYTEAGDNSVTITGLPTGSYTVTEEEPAVAIPAYTWDGVTFSADSVEITKGQTAEITATNHYSKTGGWDTAAALTITKAVTGVRSDAEQGKTYSFAIDGTDIYGGDFHRTATVTMGQDQNKTTLQVPYGTYTVSETAQAPIEGYTFTGVTYAESAEVTLSSTAKTAAVTVTNAYTRDLGTLTVEKILSAEDYETINALPDHPSFHFTAELDGEQTLTTEIGWEQLKKSGDTYTAKAVWEDVPTGAWTVAEDTARAAQDRFTLTVNGQPAAANGHLNEAYGKLPVTVVKGTDADVLFTNDYAPVYRDIERGSFEIYKYENVEGVGQPLAGVTFELYHGDEKLNSYTTGADGRVTVTLDSYLDADGSPMSFRLEEQVPAGYEKNEDANWAWEITATRAADGKVDLRASQSMDGMWDRFFDWISSIVDNDRAAFLEHGQLSIRNERIYDEPVVQDVTGGNSFSILKQDDVTEAQLHGAEFTVYGQTAAGETIPVGRSTAQSDGLRVVITGTELAKVAGAVGAHTGDTLHLTMQETKAPAGYTPDSTVWELTLTCTRTESKDPAGSFLYTYQWAVTDVTGSYAEGKLTVPNTAIDYTVRVLKQNEKGQALSGAAFTLNGAAMTAVNGHTFETTGVHYDANAPQLTIAETAAPDGYQSVGSFGLRFVAEDGVITGLEKTETTPASVTVSNEGRVFTVIVQDARMENHQTAGSITIDKTVTGDNIHAAGQTYTFTVEGESIYGENISKPVSVTVGEDNTGSAEVKVPYGTYTVTEITPAADGIEGYTFRDVTVTEERVTLSGSHTADTFHVTNHYDRMSGSEEAGTLTITKTVKGENGVTIKGQGLSFSFTVEGESIYGEKISRIVNVTVGEDNTGSAEVKVPYGTYTVTETGIPAIEGYKAPAVSVIPDAVTVSKANAAIAIEAVNIYGKMENWDAASKLTIHKTVTGGNIHAADQTYAFTVEGESIYGENISKPVSVTVGEDNTGSVTVELPYGTYTVTEQNADRTGYRWTVTGSGTQAQLTPEEPAAAVTITNDYQKDYGEDPEIVVPGVDPDPEDPKEPPVEDPEKIHEYIRDGLSFTIHKVRRGSDHIMSDVEFTLTGKNAAGEDIQLFRGRTDDKARLAITVPAELLAQVAGAAAEEPGVLTLTLTETRPAGYQQAGPWTVTLEAERSEELIGAYWYRINTWNVTSVVLTREMEQAQSDADFHPTELLDENRITEIVNIKRSGNHPDPEPSDPEATPDPEPEIVIPEPEIPLEPAPVIPAEPEVELPEEDVPLADSPATGDSTVVWALLAAFAGIVLVGLIVTGKKRKHDEQ